MRKDLVEEFITKNKKFFPENALSELKKPLEQLPDKFYDNLNMLKFKNPNTILMVSIFLSGIDRIILKDYLGGILKIVTCGGFGIWTIYDWFKIKSLTRTYNLTVFLNCFSPDQAENKMNSKQAMEFVKEHKGELAGLAKTVAKSAKDIHSTFDLN